MTGFTKRQRRIFAEAEQEVELAQEEVVELELRLEEAKTALRMARKQLHNLEEMGDMV